MNESLNKHLSELVDASELKQMDSKALSRLAEEIRPFLVLNVLSSGGHLASNLGVVEITLALHRIFDTAEDRIIWDVGHQSYVHKILTGRRERFDTLRKKDGLSGFPKRAESPHDAFDAGHSSTSISAALGFARARDLQGQNHHVIAVIGDGAITGGMCYEALNDAGHGGTRMIVILNDNDMSIAHNVGAISKHLTRLRGGGGYRRFKKNVRKILAKLPWLGSAMINLIERIKNMVKYLLIPGVFFEDLGFTYLGPVDGHDIGEMMAILENAKAITDRPVLIHAVTQKGRGFERAENAPEHYHGVAPFFVDQDADLVADGPGFSQAMGETLTRLADEDARIVAITAAMTGGTGLTPFAKRHPDRFFDVAIAEQHAVTMAAGLAAGGMRPVVAVYSTFLQRAYDQILHDACLQDLPVIFAVDRAGLVGEDGETHQGIFDIAYLRMIPNLQLLAPANAEELEMMLRYALSQNGPVAIRYPRGKSGFCVFTQPLEQALWTQQRAGRDGAILASGRMLAIALEAASQLSARRGIEMRVYNARTIKPLDEQQLIRLAREKLIVTLEDHVLSGGFGSAVAEFYTAHSYRPRLFCLGIEDHYVPQGTVVQQLQMLGLDADSVAQRIAVRMNDIDGY